MKSEMHKEESGQALLQLSFALVVLVVFVLGIVTSAGPCTTPRL